MICSCWHCEKKGCGPYHDVCPDFKAWKSQEQKSGEIRRRERDKADFLEEARRAVRRIARKKQRSR